MRRILVLGAGGHGKVVADALLRSGRGVLGFLDDDAGKLGALFLNLPVLGTLADFARHRPDGLILGLGSNAARQKVVDELGAAAAPLWCSALHPQSFIAQSAHIGRGVLVAAGAVVNPDRKLRPHRGRCPRWPGCAARRRRCGDTRHHDRGMGHRGGGGGCHP